MARKKDEKNGKKRTADKRVDAGIATSKTEKQDLQSSYILYDKFYDIKA